MQRLKNEHWHQLLSTENIGDAGLLGKDERFDISGDLRRAGFGQESAGIESSDSRTRLLQFARDKTLIVDILFTAGAYLAMTNISDCPDSGPITVSGSGFSIEAAVLRCLGEAVEHCSWIVRQDDGDAMLPQVEAAGATQISAARVLGYSAAQLSSRTRLNRAWNGWDSIPPLSQLERPQSWTLVQSFSEIETAACPTFLCYGRYGDLVAGDSTLNVDSNGCAAGQTRDAAKSRALLELVERDATGIWWHCGCVRPRIDSAQTDPKMQEALAQYRDETGRRIWFLDISTFVHAAVVAAVSSEQDGADLALGFGADFTLRDAASSAFLEVIQSEIAIEAHIVRSLEEGGRERIPADGWIGRWRRSANMRTFDFINGGREQPVSNTPMSVDVLVREIEDSCGNGLWFADLTRGEFATPVVKAVCEGLAHNKLRRRSQRYAEVRRTHGWQTTRQSVGRSDPFKLLI